MISHDLRCIFIHIPKCGGTSIEDVIWPGERDTEDLWMGFVKPHENPYQTGGLQHLTARLVRTVVGAEVFCAYYRFSIVRNPFDRAVSQYAFMRSRPDLRRFLGMDADAEFKQYLELIAKRRHVQWQPQHTFVYDDDGALLVDNVFRFERLREESHTLFRRLGLDAASLPHRKATQRGPCELYYDDEARAMVEALYSEDLRCFGYTFPGNA